MKSIHLQESVMKILFIFLTFCLVESYQSSDGYQTYKKSCYSPYVERSTTTKSLQLEYYFDEFGMRRSGYRDRDFPIDNPCDYNSGVTVDVTCDLTFHEKNTKYSVMNTICPKDNVRFFSIDGTQISVLPGSAFSANFQISELHLSNLGLTKITPGAFNQQPKIERIFLSKNNLTQISVGLFNSLANLIELDLSDNRITNISEDAFSSVPLAKLHLGKNKLVSVPDSFADIETLNISCNSINKINPSVNFNTVILDASDNEIRVFEMSEFPFIQELYLANNDLNEFDIRNDNDTLVRLDLYNNTLSKMPEDMLQLSVLNLGNNSISNLPNKTLYGNSLRELNLSANNLTYISSLTFKLLRSLEVLDLSKNSISSFSFGTFDGLVSLRVLNISYNRFKILPIRTFHAMKILNNIDFSGNYINDFSVDELFKHIPYLSSLDLRGNLLSCHKLLEIVHVLETRRVSFARGNDIDDDNIYGIKCTHLDELIDVKEKTDTSQSDPSFSALINYFNNGFKESSFVRYLKDSRNSSDMSDLKQLLDELMKKDSQHNNLLEKLTNELQTNFKNIDRDKQLNISLDIDKKLGQTLNKIAVELNRKTVNDSEFYKTLLSLERIMNYTFSSNKDDQLLLLGKFSDLDTDLKNLSETLKVTHQNSLNFLSKLLEKGNDNASIFLSEIPVNSPLNLSNFDKISMPSGKTYPVFIVMVILLVIITVLLFGFGYIGLFRFKYIVNQKSDVELTRLVESKPENVCE